jgi:hypothetical protein
MLHDERFQLTDADTYLYFFSICFGTGSFGGGFQDVAVDNLDHRWRRLEVVSQVKFQAERANHTCQ